MALRAAVPSVWRGMLTLTFVATVLSGCTFNGAHAARSFAEATGGEGLERVFWKNLAEGNLVEIERALASNYRNVTPTGILDRAATLDQYRQWHVKDYSIGDLNTEMNGNTIVVTYTITLNGTGGGQQFPAGPQHMMTVWQQQKAGWVAIAHSVSQP